MVFPCFRATVNGYVQQPQSGKGMITKGSESSGIKVYVILLKQPPKLAKMIAVNEENLKWMTEDREDEY